MASFMQTVDGGLTIVFASGEVVNVASSHHKFADICQGLKDQIGDEDLQALIAEVMQPAEIRLELAADGKVEYRDEKLYYNGEEIHSSLLERINNFNEQNLPFDHLLRFLENLFQNPSYNSREQLYKFLENEALPITEDGHFLAYKSVTNEYKDHRTGTYDNSIGCSVSMSRHNVNDNVNVGCGTGFHVGAIDYAENFYRGRSKIVICKVNPKDVVSVPEHGQFRKCRTCRYEVIAEYQHKLDDSALYRDANTPITNENNWDNDDWNDEYYDDWVDANDYI